MRKLICVGVLLLTLGASAQTYTEFYCDNATSGTSNLWAGSTLTAAPVYHSGAGTWNGTSTFTPTDGSTPASTVSAGMWASVYTNGVNRAYYIAQVVSVAAGANGVITLSTTAFGGNLPAASTVNIAVGGCWHGPGTAGNVGGSGGATNYFPAAFISQAMTNGATQVPCVNIRGGTAYAITNAVTQSSVGPIVWQGFTNTAHDGGFAVIDGGTGAANSYVMWTASGGGNVYRNINFWRNGSTSAGASQGVNVSGSGCGFERCGFWLMKSHGCSGNATYFDTCEFATNGQSGASMASSGTVFRNCNFHDNTQGGVLCTGGGSIERCIISRNGNHGISISSGVALQVLLSTISSNQWAGINFASTPVALDMVNDIIFDNHGAGVTNTTLGRPIGRISSCLFGLNVNGDIDPTVTVSMVTNNLILGAVNYPYINDTNMNFTLTSSSAAKAMGEGVWYQPGVASPTTAYPDIGASQLASTNSAGTSGGAYTFSQ